MIPSFNTSAIDLKWDENWSYSQEIKIPFDTSMKPAHFQPIDMKIDFKNHCWAKNDDEHSIRILCWDGNSWHELESQIYGLEISQTNFISSCNVVFLIPDFANGAEQYFLFYDDSEKSNPNYVDHVKTEDAFYRYEPISGYPLESNYFKIIDDDFIIYSVSYEGQIMGYNTGQHIVKMNEKTTEVLPKNGKLFAAFDFRYSCDKGILDISSTAEIFFSKEILVDGNLMVEFRIVSTSTFNDFKTTATYKYYHCPASNTRFHVHVKHESQREIDVYPNLPASNTDGVYAALQCGGIKSRSINDLNYGRILPFLHYYSDLDIISELSLDLDPEYNSEHPEITIIGNDDDVDLGTKTWVSFDDGKNGESHGLIFSSNDVLISGTDEKNGLQINVLESDYPHLPGLENDLATIQIGRNSIEPGSNHDLKIPSDFTVEFYADFFSSENDGYI